MGDDELSSPSHEEFVAPLEFAQAHINRIEDDMKHMHERHVNLLREMDTNYKLIKCCSGKKISKKGMPCSSKSE